MPYQDSIDDAGTASTRSDRGTDRGGPAPLPHKKLLIAVSGALLANFSALISGTMVINAMPLIITDLGGSQTSYTWVVISNMLMMTATMPVWGKLADQFNISRLLTVALFLHVGGGVVGAFSPSIGVLITARTIQGVGLGGLVALTAAVIARLVPERERGRFAAYGQISWATGTLAGPLIGGIVADSAIGWRGSFLVGLPVAMVALYIMSRTLQIPHTPRPVSVDYLGGTLILATTCTVLTILTLGGTSFAWASSTTLTLAGVAALLLFAAIHVETKVAKEPVIRLGLFGTRTVFLAVVAAALIGVALMASTVYLTEYYQISRGLSPTYAGLLTAPMVVALALSGVMNGRVVSATGRWKPVCLTGCAIVLLGALLVGLTSHSSPLWQVSASGAVIGIGLGASTSNLLLAVQTQVEMAEIGSASALVSFFQSLGGTIAIAVLGSVLSQRVATAVPGIGHSLPDPDSLASALRMPYQAAVGDNVTDLFLLIAPLLAAATVATLFIPESRLRATRH